MQQLRFATHSLRFVLPLAILAGFAAGCSKQPEADKTTGSYYEGAMKPKSPGGGSPATPPAPGAPAPAAPRGGGSVDN